MGIFTSTKRETLKAPDTTPKPEKVRSEIIGNVVLTKTTQAPVATNDNNSFFSTVKNNVEAIVPTKAEPVAVEIPNEEKLIEAPKVGIPREEVKTPAVERVNTREGSVLVETLLKEVNEYLAKGEEIYNLLKQKEEAKNATEAELAKVEAIKESSREIREAAIVWLEGMTNSDITKTSELANLSKEFLSAFTKLNSAIEDAEESFESAQNKASNKTIVEINAGKSSLQKMSELLGGKENIDSIVAYVRKAEGVANRYNKSHGSEILNNLNGIDVKSAILNFTADHLEMAKDLAGRGDVLSLLLNFFSEKK